MSAPLLSQASISPSNDEATSIAYTAVARRFTVFRETDEQETLLSLPQYNTHKLLAGDVLIGSLVSFVVSPSVAMVDQAIVQRAAGTHTIMSSVQSSLAQMLRQPIVYFRSSPFLWMFGLYAATYSTANVLRTCQDSADKSCSMTTTTSSSHLEQQPFILCTSPSSSVTTLSTKSIHFHSDMLSINKSLSWAFGAATSSLGVLAATSTVNITLSLLKDRVYARLFSGAAVPKHAVPTATYALWFARDSTVVASTFVLPDMLVREMLQHGYIDDKQKNVTLRSAQFAIPLLSQVAAGPLQLLGLNVYQHPDWSPMQRLRCLDQSALTSVIAARMARVLPAFSIAGVGNNYLRDHWRQWVKSA